MDGIKSKHTCTFMYKGILFKRAFYIFSQKKILLRNKATVQIRMNFIIKFQMITVYMKLSFIIIIIIIINSYN